MNVKDEVLLEVERIVEKGNIAEIRKYDDGIVVAEKVQKSRKKFIAIEQNRTNR